MRTHAVIGKLHWCSSAGEMKPEANKGLSDTEGREAGGSSTQIHTVRLIWGERDEKVGRQKIMDSWPLRDHGKTGNNYIF